MQDGDDCLDAEAKQRATLAQRKEAILAGCEVLDAESEQRWNREAEAILAQREAAFLAAIEGIDDIHEKLTEDPYDGVLGQLPEWAPKWHQENFLRIRNKLLDNRYQGDKLTPEKMLAFMDRYRDLGEVEDDVYIPQEMWADIDYLANLLWCISLGEQGGLKILAGDDAITGRSFRAAQQRKAKRPRKDRDDLTFALRRQFYRQGAGADVDLIKDAVRAVIPEGMTDGALRKRISAARTFVLNNPQSRREHT